MGVSRRRNVRGGGEKLPARFRFTDAAALRGAIDFGLVKGEHGALLAGRVAVQYACKHTRTKKDIVKSLVGVLFAMVNRTQPIRIISSRIIVVAFVRTTTMGKATSVTRHNTGADSNGFSCTQHRFKIRLC